MSEQQGRYPPKRKVRYMKKPRKKRASPLGPLLLFVIVAAIIYFVAKGGGEDVSAYDSYVLEINKLARASNEISKDFFLLRAEAFTITRGEFRARMDKNYNDSFEIFGRAAAIEPPPSLEGAHAYARLAFDLRADGMELYGPAMASVLEEDRSEAVSNKLSTALRYLILSDEAYFRFEEDAKGLLATKGATSSLIGSEFVEDDDISDSSKVSAYIKGPQAPEVEVETAAGSESKVLRGVAVTGLVVKPARIAYDEATKVATLPDVSEVSVEVTVENQGDLTESDLTVRVIVETADGTDVGARSAKIVSIASGEKKVVSIKGIKVAKGGAINLLKATAVPVEGEKITTNNTRELKFRVG
ncbi:MAG: hypothetical protein QMD53_02055 [Actinomycetota bacterium]|nr:hypothetical protein [Actinomycetota bacterium]